jgi:hypothetical protein
MKYRAALIIILLVSTTCCVSSEGATRAQYWKREVELLNTEKIQLSKVQVKYTQFEPIFDPSRNTLTIIESVDANNLVCSKWYYIITVKGDSTGVVEKASLSETGTCL